MKISLSILLFLFSHFAYSQTTVFNEGWDTRPIKLIAATANTAIVFETNTTGIGRYGKLIKYEVVGNEYNKVGEISQSEILVDYRFDSNHKLHVISLQHNHCDYNDSTNFWVTSIDTATFVVDTMRQMKQLGSFHKITFLNNEELVLIDKQNTKLYSLAFNQVAASGFLTWGRPSDYVGGLFNGQFILSKSGVFGLLLENTNQSSLGIHSSSVFHQVPTHAFSYSTDSIILLTDNAIFKTDTNLFSFKRISIPVHQSKKIVGSELYLLNGSFSTAFSLPSVNLLSVDTLKGLPSKFRLVDVFPKGPQMAALAVAEKSSALNEMVVKADIASHVETERGEVQLLGISPLDTTVVPSTGSWNYYDVTLRILCKNDGLDTINNLQCLYSDYPQGTICGPWKNSMKQLNISPGDTGSFTQLVRIEVSNASVCFTVGAPDFRLENNLNDNKSCMNFTTGIDEPNPMSELQFYPNPTGGLVHISGDLRNLNHAELFGIDGKKFNIDLEILSNDEISLNLSPLPAGIYFLKIQSEQVLLTQKIIKN